MIFGLRCYPPARRTHLASLPVRVPTVEGLLPASFGFTSRLRLAVHYGCHHRPRLAPFIQLDSAHAGHTDAGLPASYVARVCWPFAQQLPQAQQPFATQLAQAYLKACEEAGREPDAQLLAPIAELAQAAKESDK